VTDGVIGDPRQCSFDPKELIGTSAPSCSPFTEADANVIRKIWQGPHRRDGSFLWYGLPRGADFTGVSRTGGTPLSGEPFGISMDWWRFFLSQDPQWDWKTLTPPAYEQFFDQSVEEFGAVLGTDAADLAAFRDHGGKIIVWHGQADPLIYPEGTIDYYERVERHMGGDARTANFIRLFMAPGVGHCSGGPGPQPAGQLDAVLSWVEEGRAPDTLSAVRPAAAGRSSATRPLCPFPLVAKYKGSGSADDAANFVCSVTY
jgi:feruloyl esterase